MTSQPILARSQNAGTFLARGIRRNPAVALIWALTIALIIVAAFLSPTFRDPSNLADVLRQSIVLGLVAIGQFVAILGGGIDMSVGMTARLVGLSVAVALGMFALPPIVMVILGLALGALIGLVNGILIAKLGAQPFIVTLGMMTVLWGVSLAVSDGPTDMIPDSLIQIYDARIGIISIAVIVMAVVWAIAWRGMTHTKFGRSVYAVGGSASVARLAGINVNRVLILTYVISGVCAAAAGIFLLTRSGVGNPNMAQGLEFQSIVAVAIGGVSLYGGRGTIAGALGAVLLMSVVANLFDLLQISAYVQDLFLGCIVLIAVALYRAERNK